MNGCECCQGLGYWIDEDALNDGTENFDEVTCDECNGTGLARPEEMHPRYACINGGF